MQAEETQIRQAYVEMGRWVAGWPSPACVWFVHAQLAARGFDWSLAAASFIDLRWKWLALAIIPMFGTYYGRALRWAVFLKPLKPRPSIRNLLSATIIGFTAITLFGRPGEFVRPYLIAMKEGVPVTFPVRRVGPGANLRPADGLAGLRLRPHAASRRPGCRSGNGLAWVLAMGGRIVGAAVPGGAGQSSCAFDILRNHSGRRVIRAFRFLPETLPARSSGWIDAFVQGVESTRSDGALLLVLGVFGHRVAADRGVLLVRGPGIHRDC